MKNVNIGYGSVKRVTVGNGNPLVFIGGPCAIENKDHTFFMVEKIKNITEKLQMPFVFKSCYDKDCRSSPDSFHGLGLEEGLQVLSSVRREFGVPVVSDFSDPSWGNATGEVCDLVQIPAYLCRQTSMLKAAARTGRPVHLKKGQFMSPWNMKNSVKKLKSFGCDDVILADRGTFFGYNMLVNDFTCLPIMARTGYPVCFDASHSIQMPTSMGNISGGQREFIPSLVRAACGVGINALFIEVHDDPPKALSDSNTVLNVNYLERILREAKMFHELRSSILDTFGEDEAHVAG
jgi:2-dehydro-3-deoxyphosphooctonate aldolase (KDO 8-P synthase)